MNPWFTKIWNALKLASTWLKGNAHLLLLLVGIVFAFIFAAFFAKRKAENIDVLLKAFQDQQLQNSKELEALRQIQQDQTVKQQEINRKYQEVIAKIEQDYHAQLLAIDAAKEKELKVVIARNHDDPVAMATEINQLFGIPLYTAPTSP